jgi:phosphoenolpyruvate carboxylase
MDGNSEVHAKAIRETLHRQQQRVISAYYQECRALADKLSQSAGRVSASPELEARIAEYDILLPKARQAASTRHDRMPYRIFLAQVAERLPHHLRRQPEPLRDRRPVRARHPARGLEPQGEPWAACRPLPGRAAPVPRAHLRLPSRDTRRAPARRGAPRRSLPRASTARTGQGIDAAARSGAICEAISHDRGPAAGFDAAGRRTLAVFEAMMQARYKYGEQAIGDYIVSGTESADDVVSVLLLARWANAIDRSTGEVPLDIVPVLESVPALKGAGPLLKSLLDEPSYRRHLAARSGRQTVLIGYSESNQSVGIAASRDAIYRAQAELLVACSGTGIDLSFFYGRGGPFEPRRRAESSVSSRTRPTVRRVGACARPSRAKASATATGCGALRSAASKRLCTRSRWTASRSRARRSASAS